MDSNGQLRIMRNEIRELRAKLDEHSLDINTLNTQRDEERAHGNRMAVWVGILSGITATILSVFLSNVLF